MKQSTDKVWTTLLNNPVRDKRSFAIKANKDQYMIVFEGDEKISKSVTSFDVQTCTCEPLPSLPDEMDECSGAILHGYFYLTSRYGGYPAYRMELSTRKCWEKVESSNRHAWHAVVSNGSNLFFFSHESNEIYDPETDIWEAFPNMRMLRQGYATAVVGNKIYVMGGCSHDYSVGFLSSVEIYHTDARTWSPGPNLPREIFGASTAVYRNRWIIITGGHDGHDGTSSCLIFDTKTQNWMESKHNLRFSRYLHDSEFIAGSQLVLVGGNFHHRKRSRHEQEEEDETPFIESVDVSYLLPNWCVIGHLVLLRELVQNGWARPKMDDNNQTQTNGKDDIRDTTGVYHKLMTNLDSDTFKEILSFLIPP